MTVVKKVKIGDIIKLNKHWFIDAVDPTSRVRTLTAPGLTRHGPATHRTQDIDLLRKVEKMGISLERSHFVITHSESHEIGGQKDKRRPNTPFQAAHSNENGKLEKRVTIIFRGTDNHNAETRIEKVNQRSLKLG